MKKNSGGGGFTTIQRLQARMLKKQCLKALNFTDIDVLKSIIEIVR